MLKAFDVCLLTLTHYWGADRFYSLFVRSSQSKNGFYAIASQMKLLVDTPEKVLFLSDKYDVFL